MNNVILSEKFQEKYMELNVLRAPFLGTGYIDLETGIPMMYDSNDEYICGILSPPEFMLALENSEFYGTFGQTQN